MKRPVQRPTLSYLVIALSTSAVQTPNVSIPVGNYRKYNLFIYFHIKERAQQHNQ